MQEQNAMKALYIEELKNLQSKYNDLNTSLTNCYIKEIIDNSMRIPQDSIPLIKLYRYSRQCVTDYMILESDLIQNGWKKDK